MNATRTGISGRVIGAEGAPIANATVALVGGAHAYRDIAALTAADGTFRFASVAPGTYRVEARASGRVAHAEVVVGEGAPGAVEIRLDG